MRTIQKKDIQIIDKLTIDDTDSSVLFADRISSLFKQNEKTLLLDLDSKKYFLFTSYADKEIPELVAILSLLEYFEQEGYIYVLPTQEINEVLFVCDGIDAGNIAVNQIGTSYSCANDTKIEKKNDVWYVMGEKVDCMVLSEQLGERIVHFFSANRYPTPALIELKDNNYRTVTRQQFEIEMRYARGSFLIAWLALIFTVIFSFASIPYSTKYSNEYGYTTIEKSQYQALQQRLDTIIKKVCPHINQKSSKK